MSVPVVLHHKEVTAGTFFADNAQVDIAVKRHHSTAQIMDFRRWPNHKKIAATTSDLSSASSPLNEVVDLSKVQQMIDGYPLSVVAQFATTPQLTIK